MSKWFYRRANEIVGPIDSNQLRNLAIAGKLSPLDMVRRDDMPNWITARHVQNLFQQSAEPAGAAPAQPEPASSHSADANDHRAGEQPRDQSSLPPPRPRAWRRFSVTCVGACVLGLLLASGGLFLKAGRPEPQVQSADVVPEQPSPVAQQSTPATTNAPEANEPSSDKAAVDKPTVNDLAVDQQAVPVSAAAPVSVDHTQESRQHLQKGVAAAQAGDWAAAITHFDRAIALSPSAEAHVFRAQVLFERWLTEGTEKDYARCIADFTAAQLLGSAYAELIYLGRGRAYLQANDHDKALRDFDLACKASPKNAEIRLYRGRSLFEIGRYRQAFTDYDQAIQLDPNNARAYLSRGLAFQCTNRSERALADLGKALSLDPDDAESYAHRAQVLAASSRWGDAIADYSEVIRRRPDDASALQGRAIAESRQGHFDRAVDDLAQVIRQRPHDALAYLFRANAQLGAGRLSDALADYDRAIDLDRNNPAFYAARGQAYIGSAPGRAIQDLQRAVALKPDFVDAYFRLAEAYLADKQKAQAATNKGRGLYYSQNYSAALKQIDLAIAEQPDLAAAHLERGRVQLQLALIKQLETVRHKEEHKHRIQDFDAAIRHATSPRAVGQLRDKRAAEVREYSAWETKSVDAPLKQFKVATKSFERAIQLQPDDVRGQLELGKAFFSFGPARDARKYFDRAIELQPELEEARFWRAACTLFASLPDERTASDRSKRWQQAIDEFDQAVKLDPHDTEAYILRARAHIRSEKYKLAIEDLDRAIAAAPITTRYPEISHFAARAWTAKFEPWLWFPLDLMAPSPQAAALAMRGQCHFALQQIEAGFGDLDQAVRLLPNAPQAFWMRGDATNQYSIRQADALADFRRALKLDPHNPVIVDSVASLSPRKADPGETALTVGALMVGMIVLPAIYEDLSASKSSRSRVATGYVSCNNCGNLGWTGCYQCGCSGTILLWGSPGGVNCFACGGTGRKPCSQCRGW